MAAALGAGAAACNQATCADYHAPGCYVPPAEAGPDGPADGGVGDAGDPDATLGADASDATDAGETADAAADASGD